MSTITEFVSGQRREDAARALFRRDLSHRFAEEAAAYRDADPFPHAVFTDLFDAEVLRSVAREFAAPRDMTWRHANARERKTAENRYSALGPETRRVVAELHAGPFLNALEALTGIAGLMPDPHLSGGGQHRIEPGGYLKIHADFAANGRLGLDRRVNVLLYLNDQWDDEWGGALELWDPEMKDCQVRIPPRMNTLVVFSTSATSFHGHPDPVACPPGRTRDSLAFYYYTSPGWPRGAEPELDVSTTFVDRPDERIRDVPFRARLRSAGAHWLRGCEVLSPRLARAARSLRSRPNRFDSSG